MNDTVDMTHFEKKVINRRARLKEWIDIHLDGSRTAFIEKTGMSAGELSGLLNDRSFGEAKADSIERSVDMPTGYLDLPHATAYDPCEMNDALRKLLDFYVVDEAEGETAATYTAISADRQKHAGTVRRELAKLDGDELRYFANLIESRNDEEQKTDRRILSALKQLQSEDQAWLADIIFSRVALERRRTAARKKHVKTRDVAERDARVLSADLASPAINSGLQVGETDDREVDPLLNAGLKKLGINASDYGEAIHRKLERFTSDTTNDSINSTDSEDSTDTGNDQTSEVGNAAGSGRE